jgi:hypothetical protein
MAQGQLKEPILCRWRADCLAYFTGVATARRRNWQHASAAPLTPLLPLPPPVLLPPPPPLPLPLPPLTLTLTAEDRDLPRDSAPPRVTGGRARRATAYGRTAAWS